MVHNLKYNWSIWIYVVLYVINLIILGIGSFIAFVNDSEEGAVAAGIIIFIALVGESIGKDIYDTKWISDVNLLCEGDGLTTTNVATRGILSFLTCGIYRVFWDYNLQTRLKSNGHKYDVEIPESGSSILLWQTLGLLLFFFGPLIAEHIMYQSTNKLAYAYNMGKGNGARYNDQERYGNQRQERIQEGTYQGQRQIQSGSNQDQRQLQGGIYQNQKQIQTDTYQGQGQIQQREYVIEQKQIEAQGMLQCIAGSAQGRSFPISANSSIAIGKNPNRANFIIQESYISNIHCTVQYNAANNIYIVTDNSTNGTFINGVRLQKNVPVSCPPGTIICLVNTRVQIKLG